MTYAKKFIVPTLLIMFGTLPLALRADELCRDHKSKKDEILRRAVEAVVNHNDSDFAKAELEMRSSQSVEVGASSDPLYNFPPARMAIELKYDVGVAKFIVVYPDSREPVLYNAKCETFMRRVDECGVEDPTYAFGLADCEIMRGQTRVMGDKFQGSTWNILKQKQVHGMILFTVDESNESLSLNVR